MKRVFYILGQLTDEDVEWLAGVGNLRRLSPGTALIRQGSVPTSIFIVIDGSFTVTLASGGDLVKLDVGENVGVGEIFGELSLVDSRPASATVTARVDAVVLEIPRGALQQRIADDTAFASRFYRAIAMFLADRMRGTIRRMGYGYGQQARNSLAEDEEADDEIDMDLLEKVHQAGARFDRIFRGLLTGSRQRR